jgi:endonuclease III
VQRLDLILDTLEAFYGEQAAHWPTDPYLFLLWWHCGYPPSDARCTQGWASLNSAVGVSPEMLLAASTARLARALKAGGLVPELRAARVKDIARRVHGEFGGDLRSALGKLSAAHARKQLRGFPGIGDPGADRMLLFAGIMPIAAVPSSCPYVLLRIESGREPDRYAATYAQAQRAIEAQVPDTFAARSRAYLLLQRHGRQLCKLSNPKCSECPVAGHCAFVAAAARPVPRAAPHLRQAGRRRRA